MPQEDPRDYAAEKTKQKNKFAIYNLHACVQNNYSFCAGYPWLEMGELCANYVGNGRASRDTELCSLTYSNESVSQDEVAVDVEHVDIKVFSPRNLARPQVESVVDDGQRCLLDLLLHLPHHCLRGRQQSK